MSGYAGRVLTSQAVMSSNKPGARRCCPVVGSGTTIRWSASGKDDHLVLGVSGFREGGLIGGDARSGWHVHVVGAEDGQQWAAQRLECGHRVVDGAAGAGCCPALGMST
jgi:hypothetical protein